VLAVALGGWALLGRPPGPDASAKAGLLAEDRAGTTTGPWSDDHGSRDAARVALAPPLGTVVPGTPRAQRPSTPARPGHPASTAAGTLRPPAPRPPTPTTTATTSPGTPGTSTYEDEVTRLTNVERARAGCGAVRVDARLQAAAEAHSKDMVDRDYFDHTSPDGEGPGDRAAAAGYPSWSGENIAVGYPTPEAVVQGWMNSTGHRANILNCQSKATGVGFDQRKNMWTQMFGSV
jgi:uncharacterized protein YkwD